MASTSSLIFPLAAFVALAVAPAQSRVVLPPVNAASEGSGSTSIPFGRSTPTRTQIVYDARLFTGAVVVQSLALRLDGNQTSAGKRVDVEVRLSTAARPITALSAVFSNNAGTDAVVVLDRRLLDLPPHAQGQTPNPFTVQLPFDRSFGYDPARGPLLIEIIVHDQPPGSHVLDTTFTCTSEQRNYGPAGCGAGGRVLKADSATTQVLWGRPLALRVFDAPPQAATVLFLGSIESGQWNGLTIPFDLGVVGAPGCSLSIDVILQRGALADATGVAIHPFTLPDVPGLQGEWIRFQGVALDNQANPLGIVTSQATKVQICGWEPVARVYASGAGATVGLVEVGVAPVVELRVQ